MMKQLTSWTRMKTIRYKAINKDTNNLWGSPNVGYVLSGGFLDCIINSMEFLKISYNEDITLINEQKRKKRVFSLA